MWTESQDKLHTHLLMRGLGLDVVYAEWSLKICCKSFYLKDKVFLKIGTMLRKVQRFGVFPRGLIVLKFLDMFIEV